MKLLKNGFAFLIAALTISLTIAAHAGVFKSEVKSVKQAFDCDPQATPTPQALVTNLYNSNCNLISIACPSTPLPVLYATVNLSYEPFDCPPTDDILCCVEVSSATCAAGRFRITRAICGEPQI
jgi:hypothetical protein